MPESLFSLDSKRRKDDGRPPKIDFNLAERLAGAFGKRVVWTKIGKDSRYTTNGFVVRNGSLSNKVFICKTLDST